MTLKFRLTATTISKYFQQECDRLFRWDSVVSGDRKKFGIGWNIPTKIRSHSRPGIALLMQAGTKFELEQLQELQQNLGEEQVYIQKPDPSQATDDGEKKIPPTTVEKFIELYKQSLSPRFIAQLQIDFEQLPNVTCSARLRTLFSNHIQAHSMTICLGC